MLPGACSSSVAVRWRLHLDCSTVRALLGSGVLRAQHGPVRCRRCSLLTHSSRCRCGAGSALLSRRRRPQARLRQQSKQHQGREPSSCPPAPATAHSPSTQASPTPQARCQWRQQMLAPPMCLTCLKRLGPQHVMAACSLPSWQVPWAAVSRTSLPIQRLMMHWRMASAICVALCFAMAVHGLVKPYYLTHTAWCASMYQHVVQAPAQAGYVKPACTCLHCPERLWP